LKIVKVKIKWYNRIMKKAVIHVDMDAFYASVEQRDDPGLKGKPVIVGGKPDRRGVVSAASYEARKYGVHSAMPLKKAYQMCPAGVFLPVNGKRYAEVSQKIMDILKSYTPLVEQISLDEAFLDVSGCGRLFGTAEEIGKKIKREIKDKLGLTASVGIAPNMFLAKIASDLEKPDGFVIVKDGGERKFLENLPISKMWGVGEVTEKELKSLGIGTVGELSRYPPQLLIKKFGKHGEHLYKLAGGEDEREVTPEYEAKSIGNETTYQEDTADKEKIRKTLTELSEEVGKRLREDKLNGRTVTLKIRFGDFRNITRSRTIPEPVNLGEDILDIAWGLFEKINLDKRVVRLVGVSVSHLSEAASRQQLLFGDETEKKKRIAKTLDEIQNKMGEDIIKKGSLL
jgi:DNA polymerase-4